MLAPHLDNSKSVKPMAKIIHFFLFVFLTDLPRLVILFEVTMLEINFGPARAAALKIVEELSGDNNMFIHSYTLVVIDQGL